MKTNPVDIVLLVILPFIIGFLPNLFLSFFPYGKAVGLLISTFIGAILVGLIRRSKRPHLVLPKMRNRLSLWVTVIRTALILIAFAFLIQDSRKIMMEPLLGALIDVNTKGVILALVIGIPVRAAIVFSMTTLGLKVGLIGVKSAPEALPAQTS